MARILIIEDDCKLRDLLVETLFNAGYDPITANDYSQAIRLLEMETPDLVVSGTAMSGMDGYEILQHFHRLPSTSAVSFIFLSENSSLSEFRKGMSLGANDYLTKPIQVDELLQSIKIQLWKKEKLENKIYNTWLDVSAHVPHELRTPLVSILGFSKIIADEVHDLSDDEITEIADKINFSGKRLHRTIEKFLRFTDIQVRIINKKRHLYNENNVFTDTSDTIELICRKMAKDANRHDDLILEISDVRLPVDSIDFEFIVDELMNNALKFSKPGSVINVTSHIMDDCYFLEITDHGKGMTKEQIAEISPFTQHDRKDFQQMGNGLGLISVKRLADFYKGQLKIYSEVNKFTTCSVSLPTYKVVEENQIKAETV